MIKKRLLILTHNPNRASFRQRINGFVLLLEGAAVNGIMQFNYGQS